MLRKLRDNTATPNVSMAAMNLNLAEAPTRDEHDTHMRDAWYEDEYGYSMQVARLIRRMVEQRIPALPA